jgi:putative ABC transport system permease protein
MIRHPFLLIWNRKRANALLTLEIFFAFIVLFGVGTALVQLVGNYWKPLGFKPEETWRLNLQAGEGKKMPRPILDAALREVKALPGVLHVSLTSPNTPYRFINMTTVFHHKDRSSNSANRYDADDQYAAAMGLKLREGRWFRAADDGMKLRPVVMTADAARNLFKPGERVIGNTIRNGSDGTGDEFMVVGVVDEVRTSSDFDDVMPAVWARLVPFDTTAWEGAAVLVRVTPDAGANLKQRIVKTIAGATRQWQTEIRTVEEDRMDRRKYTLTPLIAMGVICGFLILNVALGLFGVLWYNINQRRSEIGLRRAIGATGWSISTQFLGETLVLAFFGIVLGSIIAVQFPLLGAFEITTDIYVRAIGLAAVFIFVLAGLCALQPSRLAAQIHPARALREN